MFNTSNSGDDSSILIDSNLLFDISKYFKFVNGNNHKCWILLLSAYKYFKFLILLIHRDSQLNYIVYLNFLN